MYGIVLPGPDVEDGVYIVKGGNCEDGKLTKQYLSKTARDIERRYERSRLRENDIVYSIRGSIGSAQLVPVELEGANLTQDAARIACGGEVNPRWLLWAVRSVSFFAKLEAGARGAAVKGINIRDLKRADIVVPPPEEQAPIAEAVERETQDINNSVATAQREIDLIREYRTRLIADVVTGKLDVRHLAPLASSEELEEAVDELEPLDGVEGEREEDALAGEGEE
jgi:type I restriction enzyme S subunit